MKFDTSLAKPLMLLSHLESALFAVRWRRDQTGSGEIETARVSRVARNVVDSPAKPPRPGRPSTYRSRKRESANARTRSTFSESIARRKRAAWVAWAAGVLTAVVITLGIGPAAQKTFGQESFAQESSTQATSEQAEPSQTIGAGDIQAIMADEASETPVVSEPSGIDMLTLLASGGRFMIPIALMSLLVVTLAAERMLSLRRGKVYPKRLVRELERLGDPIETFDPSKAYAACLNHPSPTASVIGAMLSRTGQPLGEIERAAGETVAREADRYASPVRWLSLAAAATPLMGLLGTVWGMIVAFHESTSLSADRSRSEQLSEGIYTALVTTLAGLIVAIPAAILAQYLENRIAKLFHQIEQLAFDLAPGLTRYFGRQQLNSDGTLTPMENVSEAATKPSRKSPTPPPPPAAAARGEQSPSSNPSSKAG